jgi:GH15 family glucan-1,4-alpha-glucosidase
MAYKPIEDYGIIGDLHSVALVGIDGSIDWCCLPNFDSPSVFGALLDDQKGGHFKIGAVGNPRRKQLYLPETNVLITRFFGDDGIAEITDFMPIERRTLQGRRANYHQIIRQVNTVAGKMHFRLECYLHSIMHARLTKSGCFLKARPLSVRLSRWAWCHVCRSRSRAGA